MARLFDAHAHAARIDPGLAAPVALWVRGPARLAEACERAVSVVGSRAATSYGTHLAGEFGAGLAQHGHAVVGAAALGIDAAALKGALASAGTVIAVRQVAATRSPAPLAQRPRRRLAARHAQRQVVEPALVALHQHLERPQVALAGARDQRGVVEICRELR